MNWSWCNLWVWLGLVSIIIDTVCGVLCEYDSSNSNDTLVWICNSGSNCCGENKCCPQVYTLWYFWLGLIFVVAICFGVFAYYFKRMCIGNTVLTIQPDTQPVLQRPERLFFTTQRNPLQHTHGSHNNLQAPTQYAYGLPHGRTPSPYHGNAKDLEPLTYPAYGHRVVLTPLPGSTSKTPTQDTVSTMQTLSMLQPVQPAYNLPSQPYSINSVNIVEEID